MYSELVEIVQNDTVAVVGIDDVRAARGEFHQIAGEFEDGEPWFESRLAMFVDWYVMDRPLADGRTPIARWLAAHADLEAGRYRAFAALAASLRSVFRVEAPRGPLLVLDDLVGGGRWQVRSALATAGLLRGEILDARIVICGGEPCIGRGVVLHPRDAHDAVLAIVGDARRQRLAPHRVAEHLDKARLKLDRYSNVKVQHVYNRLGDARL